MVALSVSITGTLDMWCYRNFPPAIADGDRLHLDLSGVQFCRPDGLVAVGALLETAVGQGTEVTITTPVNSNARVYMTRMRFHQLLDDLDIPHNLEPVYEHDADNRFIELSDFTDESGVLGLATVVHSRVEPVLGSEAAASVFLALSELGSNVAQHAGCERGFFMAQQFLRADRFDFAIGDPGIGLLASLQRHNPGGHDDAIRLAVQRGISAVNDVGRGEGLADIREKLLAAGGSLIVVSGDGFGRFRRSKPEGYILSAKGYYSGTLVVGSFPLQRGGV